MLRQQQEFETSTWLTNGHIQTLASQLWPKNLKYMFWNPCQRHYVDTATNDVLVVDTYTPKHVDVKADLLIVPGTDGFAGSYYILRMVDRFCQSGFRVHCMNLRGCGREYFLCKKLYHIGLWQDILLVANNVRIADNLFILGLSLGGHILLNLAARADIPDFIKGIATISAPLDFTTTPKWQYNVSQFYHWYFLRLLMRIYGRLHRHVSTEPIAKINDLEDFNHKIMAPMHGYQSSLEYYRENSVCFQIDKIKTDTLMIFAKDDPVIPANQYQKFSPDIHKNSNIKLLLCDYGGHVGFIGEEDFWAEDHVHRFFHSLLKKVS
ncbi:YheT family hydrolase [Candidatus Uabimicrobium amorphum]|uniref:Alpha/beta hydrolase n=1 Tax=Uabimicrobium amorphum TaxID=2596890 RepID=A0A5S9IIK1_UABAM|nr:alpha/beta fold hydrolase [Candidatus Uabimicrobium amorphum]BBM82498.1 alpha/beta hydrolase [Candidatus Uabimicrobium amorphum]